MVVFDPQLQQLSLRDNSAHTVDLTDCPYCHRPLRDGHATFEDDEDETIDPGIQPGYVDPNYFRMLAHSTPGSAESSAPSTPRRRVPALRSGGSRNISTSGPPSGAEFVGSVPAPTATDQGIQGSSFVPGYFKTFFVEKRVLGRGGRGVVLLVEHFLDHVYLGDFACKRIPVGNDHEWLAKVLVEVQILQKLNHQNLVSYRHVWLEDAQITKFGPSVPCIFILQQYCNAGDLHDYVHSLKAKVPTGTEEIKKRHRRRSQVSPERPADVRSIPFDEIFSFFRDITSGLHHLHTNGYIHRDLKPSNCLLTRDGQKLTVLVSDFGEVQAATATRDSTGATGTISYCAPEVLRRESPDGAFGNFSTKSDIFSLGMIVYFMCFARLPYVNADLNEENEDLDSLKVEIAAWAGFDDAVKIRGDLPEKLYKFLKRLLSLDPAERPSTDDILQGIKGGAGLEDFRPMGVPSVDDLCPRRFSAADSPAPRTSSHRRTPSGSYVRPELSQLGRHGSNEIIRPREVLRHRGSIDTSKTNQSTRPVLQTEDMKPPIAFSSPTRQAPQLPRLMLPPPPTPTDASANLWEHPNTILLLRGVLFLSKIFTISYPCMPYSSSSFVLYPLLSLAALDLGVFELRWSRSLILLGIHLLVVSTLHTWGRLCTGRLTNWQVYD